MTSSEVILKRVLLWLLAVLIFGVAVTFSFVHVISPTEATVTAIDETFYRIHLYAKEHGTLPDKLTDLTERPGYANRTADGWGRALQFEVHDGDMISLRSLGKDGRSGGTGSDRDIVRSYKTRDQNGRFFVADKMWVVTARMPQPEP